MHGIQMDDYEEKSIIPLMIFYPQGYIEEKNVSMSENVLVSPSDGFVSIYHINENSHFRIKGYLFYSLIN